MVAAEVVAAATVVAGTGAVVAAAVEAKAGAGKVAEEGADAGELGARRSRYLCLLPLWAELLACCHRAEQLASST